MSIFDTGFSDAHVASSNGTPLPGLSLRQHAASAGDQYLQSVTSLADGGYLIAWRGSSSTGEDGIGLYVQRFGADGSPAGDEALLVAEGSRTDVGLNWNWDITGLAGGGFALTWTHWTYENSYGAWQPVASDVVSRVYDAAGQPLADIGPLPKPLDDNGQQLASNSDDSEVAGLQGGGFVRVWENTTEDMIYSQMYDAAGNKVGGSLRAYDLHLGPQPSVYDGQVAALLGGGFVITWEMNNHSTTENGRDVYAQVYSSAGAGSGAFLVNTGHTLASQDNQVVAALGSGGFVIVWDDAGHGVDWDPTYGYRYYEHRGIYAQIYDAAGRPVGAEFAVETGATSVWNSPVVVSSTADGGFVAVWGEGDSLSPSRVGQRFDEAGNRIGEKFTLGEGIGTSSSDGSMQLITLADGSLLAAWYQYSPGGDTFGQRLAVGSRDADELIEGRSGIANDVIYGHGGNDVVFGLAGDDELHGGIGNDTLDGGTGSDELDGQDGDDVLVGGTGADLLVGGLGVDTAQYAGSAARVTVSLSSGLGVGGEAAGDTLSGVENILGSAFDDRLKGDSGANRLDGGDGDDTLDGQGGGDTLDGQRGNDVLMGAAGADLLVGGEGVDTANYSGSTGGVVVSFMSGNARYGHAEGDRLSGVENAVGSAFDDRLKGDSGANRLDGAAGDDALDGQDGEDVLAGGAGADLLVGGSGVDTADFSGAAGVVMLSLIAGRGSYGDAAGDMFSGVENVIGSAFGDTLKGDNGANRLEGGSGDDRLDGQGGDDVLAGVAGADLLVGGLGTDTADYSGAAGLVMLSLIADRGSYGDAAGDTFSGVENVIGSAFDDTLKGDNGANRLEGRSGDDRLDGQGGHDIFVFGNGVGDDTIYGFAAGAGTPDAIDLSANSLLNSFADVLTHSSQSGLDTLIDLGAGDLLTLAGVTRTSLHQDDFVF